MKIKDVFYVNQTWIAEREDGRFAVAIDSDVSIGTDEAEAVAPESEWFDSSDAAEATIHA